MKATLTVRLRNDLTEELQTLTVTAEVANTDQALFAVVTHLVATLQSFAPRGTHGNWLPLDVATRVTDCPAGFFAKQQEQAQPKGGGAHG